MYKSHFYFFAIKLQFYSTKDYDKYQNTYMYIV